MNKKTVFLLQATKEQNEELAKKFEDSKDYEVCGMAVDGISAVCMIEDKKPNVLITELVIAGYDGLSVIAKVKALNLNTKIVVLSSLISEEIIYRMTLEEKVSSIFINVGIPPHIKGYSFLREGVIMAVNDPEIINNITKKLYPQIGEKYQTSASKVERAIRHAIEVAWNRGRIESINSILGVRAYIGAEKPTNGEFIALVADKMLLENM